MTFDEWLEREIKTGRQAYGREDLLKLVRAYRKLTKGWVTKEILTLEKSLTEEKHK